MLSRTSLLMGVGAIALMAACHKDPKATATAYKNSGDRYVAEGKVNEAIIQYRNAVAANPGAADVRRALGESYLRTGDIPKALEEFVRAADLAFDPAVALKAGNLFLLTRRFDDAKYWAEKVLARAPNDVPGQLLLAAALAGLNDIEAAVAQIEESIRLEPSRGSSYANLGAVEMSRGRRDAAESAFKKAVELDPQSVEARLALGNFYWTQSAWSDAERELKTAVEHAPANVLARRALASFYLATARPDDAEPQLRQVYELTQLPTAALALADFYIARKDDRAAETVLAPLLTDPGTAPLAQVRLAAADFRRGRKTEAHARLAGVLNRDATNLDALVAKTVVLVSERRFDEARETAALAVAKHPDSASALFWLGRVEAARHRNDAAIEAFNGVLKLNPRATDASIALAQLHLAAGRPGTAIGMARQVIANEPDNLSARLAVARGLIAEQSFVAAEHELREVVAHHPKSAEAQAQLGIVRGLRKDAAGARQAFSTALTLDPTSSTALSGLVTLDLANGRPAEALARVDERIARNRNDPAILFIAARAYAAAGNLDKAESLLRRTVEVEASYFDAYAALGQLYLLRGRTESALAEFDRLAEKGPRPVGALTLSGVILQSQGKIDESRERFKRALQIDPNAPVAANNLAWMYADAGDQLDAALDLARRAVARIPDSPEVNDTLGWVHYKSNRPEQAIPFFEKSARSDAGNATYHYHLGLAFAGKGDETRAKDALERALKLNPNFAEADDARRVLSSLSRPASSF